MLKVLSILVALLLLGSGGYSQPPATEPDSKPEPKPSLSPRECLPSLLQKALLDNTREQVDSLTDVLKIGEGLLEGDVISRAQVHQATEQLLQARIRLLRHEKDYLDALDQLRLRFDVKPERLKEIEESVAAPLANQFRRFRKLEEDSRDADGKVLEFTAPEAAPRLRKELVRLFMMSALVKETNFARRIRQRWDAWEKRSDRKVKEQLDSLRKEHLLLLDLRAELERKGEAQRPVDHARLAELIADLNLGNFEAALRLYEANHVEMGKPKKPTDPAGERERVRQFQNVAGFAAKVLEEARNDRQRAVREGWPALPSIEVDNTGLLMCAWDHAERILVKRLKKPDAIAAATAKLRNVRVLAETYRLQQRLAELSCIRRSSAQEDLTSPPLPGGIRRESGTLQELLSADGSLTQVRGDLCRTWFDYQVTRLNLFRDLGLTLP